MFWMIFLCITFLFIIFTVIGIIQWIRLVWWWVWWWWVWLRVYWDVRFYFSLWWIHWSCLWRGIWIFCPDRNRVNWWHCYISNVRTKLSWFQRCSTHKFVLKPKTLSFSPSSKISFVTIFLFWPHPAHSKHCNFSKKMTRCRPVGSIRQPSEYGSGGAEGPEFIQWVDGLEPQMHEVWCFSSDGITRKVHSIARVDVGVGVVGQLSSD